MRRLVFGITRTLLQPLFGIFFGAAIGHMCSLLAPETVGVVSSLLGADNPGVAGAAIGFVASFFRARLTPEEWRELDLE